MARYRLTGVFYGVPGIVEKYTGGNPNEASGSCMFKESIASNHGLWDFYHNQMPPYDNSMIADSLQLC